MTFVALATFGASAVMSAAVNDKPAARTSMGAAALGDAVAASTLSCVRADLRGSGSSSGATIFFFLIGFAVSLAAFFLRELLATLAWVPCGASLPLSIMDFAFVRLENGWHRERSAQCDCWRGWQAASCTDSGTREEMVRGGAVRSVHLEATVQDHAPVPHARPRAPKPSLRHLAVAASQEPVKLLA